jgi:hypothetical protein
MRPRSLLPLLVLLLVCGCASRNQGKIEGTKWTSVAATVKGHSFAAGVLQLDFGQDGRFEYHVGAATYTGTHSPGMGDWVTVQLDQGPAGRKTHRETVKINDDTLTLIDSDGTQLNFNRVK